MDFRAALVSVTNSSNESGRVLSHRLQEHPLVCEENQTAKRQLIQVCRNQSPFASILQDALTCWTGLRSLLPRPCGNLPTKREAYDLLEPLVWMGVNLALKLGIALSMVAADNSDMVAAPALLWEDCYRVVAEAKSDLASPMTAQQQGSFDIAAIRIQRLERLLELYCTTLRQFHGTTSLFLARGLLPALSAVNTLVCTLQADLRLLLKVLTTPLYVYYPTPILSLATMSPVRELRLSCGSCSACGTFNTCALCYCHRVCHEEDYSCLTVLDMPSEEEEDEF